MVSTGDRWPPHVYRHMQAHMYTQTLAKHKLISNTEIQKNGGEGGGGLRYYQDMNG